MYSIKRRVAEKGMKEKILSDIWLKILSVLLAILLWIIVINTENPIITRSFYNIPVSLLNEKALTSIGKEFEVVEGDTVTVTATGRKKTIDALKNSDFVAEADLSELSIVGAVPIKVRLTKSVSSEVEFSLPKVKTCKIKYDNKKTSTFPIDVNLVGEPQKGYAVGTKKATPNLLQVSGSETLINKISSVLVTLDITGAYKDLVVNLEPEFYDKDGNKLDSTRLKYDMDNITVTVSMLKTKTVKLNINTVGDVNDEYGVTSIDYEPKTVVIAGTRDDLVNIDEIVVDDLDISDITENLEEEIDISKYLPEGIIIPEVEFTVKVKVGIEKYQTKTIYVPTNSIQIIGKSSDFSYEINNSEVKMQIKGLGKDIENITSNSFTPIINVSDLSSGEYNLNLNISEVKNITVLDCSKINISITKK